MKRLLTFILLFAVCLSLTACKQSNDSLPGSDQGAGDSAGNTGDSKKMTTLYLKSETIRYDANGNEIRHEVFEYDDQGRPIQTTCIRNGEVDRRDVFEYDSDGNMIFWLYTSSDELYRQQKYNSERSMLLDIQYRDGYEAYHYEYNDYGHAILWSEYYDGQERLRFTYEHEYDDQGNKISTVSYINENSWREEFEYDEDGNLLREVWIGADGKESLGRSCEYDSDGNMLLDIHYADGKESSRKEYEYDDQGNKIVEVEYGDNSVTRQEYNTRGQSVLYLSYYDGEESYRSETEYDDRGNLILEVDYHDGIETRRYSCTYEYNEQGKRTLFTQSEDGVEYYRQEYEYDDQGNKILETTYYDEEVPHQIHYSNGPFKKEYDSNGRPTKSIYSNGETEVYHYVEFTTDEESAEELKNHYLWLRYGTSAAATGTVYL